MKILVFFSIFIFLIGCGSKNESTDPDRIHVKSLSDETQDTLYHLSLCFTKMYDSGLFINPYIWIGSSEKWEDNDKNYGFNFNLYSQEGGFLTEINKKAGRIELNAEYLENPPEDASSYNYTCEVIYVNY
ncbi:MAG: hypothetical protein H6621_05960 [Halobacteriovoraceae bacterium]|nr:hypothetical protein [Halobacteriovoraceae bacterium]